MKFCQHCGKEVDDDAVVCVNCGCPVEGAKTTAAPASNKKSGCAVAGFVLSLLGLIFVAIQSFAPSVVLGMPFILSYLVYILAGAGLVLSIVGTCVAAKKKLAGKGLGIAGIILAAIAFMMYTVLPLVLLEGIL